MTRSSGYERNLRLAFDEDLSRQRIRRLWVPRVRCRNCRIAPGLLPAFCLLRRLDPVEVIGGVLASVATGHPVAGAAGKQAIPRSTARGWIDRLKERAPSVAAGFSSLAVSLGDASFDLGTHRPRAAMEAIGAAWHAASARLGGRCLALWRFASVVSGGALIGAATDPPWGVDLGCGLLSPFG